MLDFVQHFFISGEATENLLFLAQKQQIRNLTAAEEKRTTLCST